MIVAVRDGNRIRIVASDDTSAVGFRGRTPVRNLAPPPPVQHPKPSPEPVPEPEPEPEPVRTPVTLTPGHVLCYECDGLGWCPGCGGRGWLLDRTHRRKRCGTCATRKVCPICQGAGQLSTSDLSPYQRRYFPELDRRTD